jgi:predicted amidophosphoribosyltransferase
VELRSWRSWSAAAGDLLLGAVCPGCRDPGWGLCPDCRTDLTAGRPALVPSRSAAAPATMACCSYDALLSHLVTAHKDHGALGLAPVLAGRLALSVHALLRGCGWPGPVVLVPVPSAAAAVRRRGYDATATLARLAARQLRPTHRVQVRTLLAQRRGVRDQAGLDAAQRSANLDGALRLRRGWIRGWSAGAGMVLVDDVVTTGSSFAEAARALQAAALPVLGAATVAATPAPGGGRSHHPSAARPPSSRLPAQESARTGHPALENRGGQD